MCTSCTKLLPVYHFYLLRIEMIYRILKGFVLMDKNTRRLDGIVCDAEKCAYNENHECHATSIKVESGSASKASQTECSTFKNKCDC